MDFFAEQARQRTAGRRLVVLFALAVAVIVALVDAVAWWLLNHRSLFVAAPRSSGGLLALVTLGVAGGILGCSLYRIRSLASGGRAVAESFDAEEVPDDVADPRLRRLRNVIEEMAIASGVPVPGIYVMPGEPGINAFAAGYAPDDAVICVTEGCLEHLTRDELQGVIGHEFSHVLNGDMRLNIRVMGLLFGIQALGLAGRRLLGDDDEDGWGRRRRGNTLQMAALGLALMAIGYVGLFFGRLIQAALSRSRESLADASAVQFTRQADGLVGALKKVASIDEGSRLLSSRRAEVAHMLFGEAGRFHRLFATHPPLLERIKALDPSFSATALKLFAARYEAELARRMDEGESQEPAEPPEPLGRRPAAAGMYAQFGAAIEREPTSLTPVATAMPEMLVQAARQTDAAMGLAVAFALSPEREVRERQERLISDSLGEQVRVDAAAAAPLLVPLALKQRHLLLSLAIPTLRRLDPSRRSALLHAMDQLVRANGRLGLREYFLLRLLRAPLGEVAAVPPAVGNLKLAACRESYAFVAAVLACYGARDESAARQAWWLAMQEALPGEAMSWPVLPAFWQDAFDTSLDELDQLSAVGKELALQGLLRAARADGEVTGDEVQLLRLICASLHCAPPAALTTP